MPAYPAAAGATPGPDVYPPQAGVPGAHDGPIPLVPRIERRRRRLTRVAALLLLLLAALGAGGYLLRDRLLPDPPDSPPVQIAAGPVSTPTEVAAAPQPTQPPVEPTTTAAPGGSVLDPPTATAPASNAAQASTATRPTADADAVDAEEPAAAAQTDQEGDQSDAPPADQAPEDLLPTAAEVPEGLVETEEGSLDRDAVLAALGGTEEADELLDQWGWSENVFRYFATGEGESTENGITAVTVSIHRFGDDTSAADALQYFSDYLITGGTGYEAVEGETIGDQTRWLRQETAVGTNIAAYLRVGTNMVRIGGFSPETDPAPDVATIAQMIADA